MDCGRAEGNAERDAFLGVNQKRKMTKRVCDFFKKTRGPGDDGK